MDNRVSGMSPPIIKKPTIRLLLFKDGWADGDDHDKARYDQGHCNKCYQEDATSAGGKFASDDPVLVF